MKSLFVRYGVVGITLFFITYLMFQNIFQAKKAANDVMAQTILRKISNILENHKEKNGAYPSSLEDMVIEEHPYYLKYYFKQVHHGFRFERELSADHYAITATPASPSLGSRKYTVTNGGQFY